MHRFTQPLAARAFARVLSVAPLVLALSWPSFASAQTIPADAKPTCTVSQTTFNGWFASTHPALNGVVNPANSLTLNVNQPNCPFYQWSKQMFLWLTSPAPALYGGGAHIFDSPTFYDVSPPDATTGKRTLIQHHQGLLTNFALRAAQVGPHGLPVIVDKEGAIHEFQLAAPEARPLVKNSTGKLVPLVALRRDEVSRRLVLQDAAGKEIVAAPKPAIVTKMSPLNRVPATLFRISGLPIIISSTGTVIETEEGQAGGDGVLVTQNGSLVFYVTMVNDVYAYFATMVAHQTVKTTQFPTTAAGLQAIVNFDNASGSHKITFPDPNALAIEVKSAWVLASSLPNNAAGYITMEATIPKYDTSSHTIWKQTGETENVNLALVGMHVVGSTTGHPEMVWSTFEHFGNAPNAVYSYINASGQTRTVPQDTSGTWLFTKSNSTGPFNSLHAFFSAPDIFSASCNQNVTPVTCPGNAAPITPSDTIRVAPWGAAANASPNPVDASAAVSNTEIISIHNSVLGLMPSGDIRNNYFMTGSTWTIGGLGSTGSFGNPGNNTTSPGTAVGTSQINNTSMETYQQSPLPSTFNQFGGNCLLCHNSNTTAVSHDFGAIQPLF